MTDAQLYHPTRDFPSFRHLHVYAWRLISRYCTFAAPKPLAMIRSPWSRLIHGRVWHSAGVTLHSVLKRDGEAAVADWASARDLRRRLEQLVCGPTKAIAILSMKSGDTQTGVTTVLGLTISRDRQYWLYGFFQLLNIFLSSAFVDNQIQVLVRAQIKPEGDVSCC